MATKKTTIRHKKNKKGQVVETFITHREPAKEPAKPKPQNVADAWDAMKAAHDAPMWIRHQTVNPYRAEQDKRDLLAKLPQEGSSHFPIHELAFDPKRRMAPSHETVLTQWGTRESTCSHRRLNGDLTTVWMEHSQGIIKGVCLHCFFPFDTRNPEHLKLYEENARHRRSMGHAAQGQIPGTGVGAVYGSEWQIFRYNYFPWLEVLQRRIVARFRALKKWIFTDF